MLQQNLVHTSRVTRRNITKTTFNNNSAELIDNALFGATDTGINLILSAIESIDDSTCDPVFAKFFNFESVAEIPLSVTTTSNFSML